MAQPATATDCTRIARFLALGAEVRDRVTLAEAVAAGLPIRSAEAVQRAIGARRFDAVLPGATFRRVKRSGKNLTRESSEKLYEFSRVHDMALRLYKGDAEAAQAFLDRPHPMLGGRTPLALATSSSAGADAVTDLLTRAEAGFAA